LLDEAPEFILSSLGSCSFSDLRPRNELRLIQFFDDDLIEGPVEAEMVDFRLLHVDEQEAAASLLLESFDSDQSKSARSDVALTFRDYPFAPISAIAIQDGSLCGFVQGEAAYFHHNIYNLLWLAVRKPLRSRGIGSALLLWMEQHIIATKFQNRAGSFMLVARYKQEFYERLGYQAGLLTHDGFPIMIKHFKPAAAIIPSPQQSRPL
jgi:GNAT superfamily N-acetyltransferase